MRENELKNTNEAAQMLKAREEIKHALPIEVTGAQKTETRQLETKEFESKMLEDKDAYLAQASMLKALSDSELLRSTDFAVAKEKEAITNVTRHFLEILIRRAYLPKYASLFEMLLDEYGYCAGSAQLRINAVKLIQQVPGVKEKLESGEMSMSAAAHIQTFLAAEKKAERPYSVNAKIELIETCVGKSVAEVHKEFARRNPEIEKREVVRPTSEDRVRVSHSLTNEVEEKLQRIKLLWSHVDPNMSREMMLDRMAEIVLDKIDPVRKLQRTEARAATVQTNVAAGKVERPNISFHPHEMNSPSKSNRSSRYVKADVKRDVLRRNGGMNCEYVDASTSRRCGSTFQPQLDHIEEFARGGANEANNLRYYCAHHNRWRSRVQAVTNEYDETRLRIGTVSVYGP